MTEETNCLKENSCDWGIISKYRTALMGIGTLLVLLIHGNEFYWAEKLYFLKKIVNEGSIGVEIFLFLSGIGLFFSMQKDGNVLKFYSRRFRRIIPIYLLIAIPVYAILIFWCGSKSISDYLIQVSTLGLWLRSGQFWYVSFILPLYLLYPIIFYFISESHEKITLTSLLALSFILKIALIIINVDYYNKIEVAVSRLPVFFIGCYCGKLVFYKKQINPKTATKVFLITLPLFLLIRILNSIFISRQSVLNESIIRISNLGLTFFIIYTAIICLNFFSNHQQLIFESFLNFFGKYSLEIYLVHSGLMYLYKVSPLDSLYPQFCVYYIFIVPVSILLVFAFAKLSKFISNTCFVTKRN